MIGRVKTIADYRSKLAHWNIGAPGQETDALAVTCQLLKLLKVVVRDPVPWRLWVAATPGSSTHSLPRDPAARGPCIPLIVPRG